MERECYFGLALKEILFLESFFSAEPEGQEGASHVNIWGESIPRQRAWLVHLPESKSMPGGF